MSAEASTKTLHQDNEGGKDTENEITSEKISTVHNNPSESLLRLITPELVRAIIKFPFNAEAIERKVSDMIGNKACQLLSILVAINGPNISKYGSKKIYCEGKLQGEFSIRQLVDKKVLAQSTTKEQWDSPGTPVPIDKICEAVPYAPLLYAKLQKENGKDCSIFKKNIVTSLPFEMQFVQAGSLPLTEKLRAAHITFTVKYFKSLGMSFHRHTYQNQERHSKFFVNMEDVMAIINDLEAKIVLNPDEVGMTVEKATKI